MCPRFGLVLAFAMLAPLALVAGCRSPAPSLPAGRLVDLTHAFDADTIFWPTEPGFALEQVFAGRTEAGYYYAANRFRSAEHGGTHVDAPLHFAEGRSAVDAIALERLVGEAVVVDARAACAADPDHAIGVAELEAFEARHGAIPRGAIVLLHTGFAARWPDRERYLGSAVRGPDGVAQLRFPGLAEPAARWLVARGVGAVGIDTASIDPGRSTLFESHRALFEHEIPAFENLAGLEQLPPRGAFVVALPMKIRGGSGAPLRAIAILPSE